MGSVCQKSDSATTETKRKISKDRNVNIAEENESNALCENSDDDINRNSCNVLPIAVNKTNLNKRNMNMNRSNMNTSNMNTNTSNMDMNTLNMNRSNMNRSNMNRSSYIASAQQREQSEKEKTELKKQKEKQKQEDASYNNDTDFDEKDFEYILSDRLQKRYDGSKSIHISHLFSQKTNDDRNPWNMSQFKQKKLETYFINAYKYDFVQCVKILRFGGLFQHYYQWLFNVINNKYSAPFFVERLSLSSAKSQDFKDDEKFFELFRSITQTKHETDKIIIQYLSRHCQNNNKDEIGWFLPDDVMNTIVSYSFYSITHNLKCLGYKFEINAKNLRVLFDEIIPIYLPQLKEIDLPRMNASFAKDLCDIYGDFVDKYQNQQSNESNYNENMKNHPFGLDSKQVQFHFFGEIEDYFKEQFKRLIDNEQFDVQIERHYVKRNPQPKFVSVTISRVPPLSTEWQIYDNSDNIPYFYNTETGETTWSRPFS